MAFSACRADGAPDSFFITNLALCEVRLYNSRDILWLLLIPQGDNYVELTDLSQQQRYLLMDEIARVSRLLQTHFPCDKLNVATLGNVQPQLHVHVIARRKNDPYFPRPSFGLPVQPYEEPTHLGLISQLRELLCAL